MKDKPKNRPIDEVQAEYGRVIKPDKYGYYDITRDDVYHLLAKNGIYLNGDDYDYENRMKKFTDDILRLWKNQKEMITSTSLDNYSEEENGLQFKHYVLCEEYIKDSNITSISKRLNISRPTIYEWLKRDDVQQYLKTRKEEIEADAKRVYKDTFYACFDTLQDVITGIGYAPADQIKAIDVYLKHYINLAKLNNETAGTDNNKLDVNIQVIGDDDSTKHVAEWRKIKNDTKRKGDALCLNKIQ